MPSLNSTTYQKSKLQNQNKKVCVCVCGYATCKEDLNQHKAGAMIAHQKDWRSPLSVYPRAIKVRKQPFPPQLLSFRERHVSRRHGKLGLHPRAIILLAYYSFDEHFIPPVNFIIYNINFHFYILFLYSILFSC